MSTIIVTTIMNSHLYQGRYSHKCVIFNNMMKPLDTHLIVQVLGISMTKTLSHTTQILFFLLCLCYMDILIPQLIYFSSYPLTASSISTNNDSYYMNINYLHLLCILYPLECLLYVKSLNMSNVQCIHVERSIFL